jgi:glycerophosphoryl diester phosphodiesterase
LKAETIQLATTPHTRSLYPPEEQDRAAGFYGFGWNVSAEGVYSHGGSDGTFAWVDPKHEIIGIVFTQSPGGKPPRNEFLRLVSQAVSRGSDGDRITPHIVGHRGLLHHAPENTLAGFAACLDLRLGFELDVHRTRDGHLVCVHDDDVKRTTNGTGKVSELTLAELRKLDAGGWFDPAFAGQRAPTLYEVFALLKDRHARQVLVAVDLKIDDATAAADIVRLAEKHGVVEQLVCIGRTISEPAVRRRFRAANPKIAVAMLAQTAEDLPAALSDRDSHWVYIRFVPTAEQVAQVHREGKKVFLVGPTVSGREPDNWRRAREAGVDAVLTDYPLECRQVWRSP